MVNWICKHEVVVLICLVSGPRIFKAGETHKRRCLHFYHAENLRFGICAKRDGVY